MYLLAGDAAGLMMEDLGFDFEINKNGELVLTHHGRFATKFSSSKAVPIVAKLAALDANGQQQLMARLTGNYKRGNEKLAKNHPRHR